MELCFASQEAIKEFSKHSYRFLLVKLRATKFKVTFNIEKSIYVKIRILMEMRTVMVNSMDHSSYLFSQNATIER